MKMELKLDIGTKDIYFINKAKDIAAMSDYRPYRLGAIAVYKKHIISVGFNSSSKTHPLQKIWDRERHFNNNANRYFPSLLHAEIHCLSQIKPFDVDFSKVCLYIARIKRDGSSGMARPCPACFGYIKNLGIRNIYYTTDKGYAFEYIKE